MGGGSFKSLGCKLYTVSQAIWLFLLVHIMYKYKGLPLWANLLWFISNSFLVGLSWVIVPINLLTNGMMYVFTLTLVYFNFQYILVIFITHIFHLIPPNSALGYVIIQWRAIRYKIVHLSIYPQKVEHVTPLLFPIDD